MKAFLRRRITAVSAVALLLPAAGWLGFQEVRRQNAVKSAEFIEQYTDVIQQLRGNVESVHKKMQQNEVMIPAPVAEIRPEPAPVLQVAVKDRTFTLQGISWSEESPLVMIEDQIYKPGDQIGRLTVQEIFPRHIVLRDVDGAQREISLIQGGRP